jgi:hypothetical protein
VGDFIDRGPNSYRFCGWRERCAKRERAEQFWAITSSMRSAGRRRTEMEDSFERTRKKNAIQHKEFLRQLGEGSADYLDTIQWFRNLPVWLDFSDFRVVHACWHEPSRAALRSYVDGRNCFTEDGLREAHRRDTQAYAAAEILLKGPEQRLPPGMCAAKAAADLGEQGHVPSMSSTAIAGNRSYCPSSDGDIHSCLPEITGLSSPWFFLVFPTDPAPCSNLATMKIF